MFGSLDAIATLLRRLGHLGTLATSGSHHVPDAEVQSKNAKTGKMAIGVIVAMFLFGFASIPLYRWVCAQTDPGGSSWFIGEPDVYDEDEVEIDTDRTVRINFNTNVDRQLPWNFGVQTSSVDIHPGEQKVVHFDAANVQSEPSTGKAVYDISPPEAAAHFKKTECFCFIEQTLDAGDELEFPLVFWFESELPEHVEEINLGYTFFNAESSRARAEADNP